MPRGLASEGTLHVEGARSWWERQLLMSGHCIQRMAGTVTKTGSCGLGICERETDVT